MLDSVESRGSGRLPAEFLDQSQSRTRAPRPPSHQISSRLSAPWSLLQRHKLYGSPPRPYFSMKKSRQKTYLGQIGSRLSASRSHRRVTACTARRRGVPFVRTRRRGLRSMSGCYPYGIGNPPTLRRSSFPQRALCPAGGPMPKYAWGCAPRPPCR